MSAEPKENTIKPRCFVISPIGKDKSPQRLHADMVLHSIIGPALQSELQVIRSDAFDHSEMITANVIKAITTYELAVADLSYENPNVFYELGLRHMTSKPVIHICNGSVELPFDNAGVNTIFFDINDIHSHHAARAKIVEFAKKMLGKGYKASNPVTAALGAVKLADSPDSKDQIIADHGKRLSALEQVFQRLAVTGKQLGYGAAGPPGPFLAKPAPSRWTVSDADPKVEELRNMLDQIEHRVADTMRKGQ